MEDNTMVTDTVKAEEVAEVKQEEPKAEKTFTRAEFNSALAGEKKRMREEILAEIKAEQTEAERLASLTKDERHKEELSKANERASLAEAKLNAYQLKEQTLKDNTDIPIELINLIDFSVYNTADKVQEKLDTIKQVYKHSVETGLNESLREKTPKTVVSDNTTSQKRISRMSY